MRALPGGITLTALCATAALAAAGAPGRPAEPGPAGFFEGKVRPVLKAHCLGCHSGEQARGGLRLDTAAGVRKGGGRGPAVASRPGEESLLLRAVRHQPGVPKMPPGKRLSSPEVEVLAEWVRRGTPWSEPHKETVRSKADETRHWAFQPLRRPTVPAVKGLSWPKSPVDRFILARLESRGLRPSPPADRRTLIRRVTYDLTGLPPTPEEVQAFAADRRPDAYERLVDRLLASPRYGERWGRHWLDVAHYADTHGYDKDKRRENAWPYRDYVIRSLNSDKPYGRFIREQVAGDVLYPEDPDGAVATGFIAAGPWDFVGHVELREGTVEKEKTRVLDRDDMVANVIATFNSLTVHCARCHDHKFDPISQKEYYSLQAVFSGVERGDRPLVDPAVAARKTALERSIADLERGRRAILDAVHARDPKIGELDREAAALRSRLTTLPTPAGAPASPSNGYHSGIEARPDVEKWVQVDLGRPVAVDEIRLIPARPTDFRDTPGFGFPVRFRVETSLDAGFTQRELVADHTGADFPNPGQEPFTIDLGGRTARVVRVTATRLWPRTNDYVFALAELEVHAGDRNLAPGAAVTSLDSIEAGRWSRRHLTDGFDSRSRLPGPDDPAVATVLRQQREIRVRLRTVDAHRAARVSAAVDSGAQSELDRLSVELARLGVELKALPAAPRVYGVVSRAPRPVQVLARGDVEQPVGKALPAGLACIAGLAPELAVQSPDREGSRRAALAEWIASPKNALTWRSIVNRAWHYHFGRGLVDTPNDFGRNGSRPSHPELLDWLATWFLENGQSLKKLHRLLVTSAVYRQASSPAATPASARSGRKPTGSAAAVDGDNRLLWRMNRRRLDAEEVRDTILAVSGKLDLTMGGPGYALFRFKDDHSPVYDHTAEEGINDPATWRRTVYRFTVRSVPNPFLDSLDCADPNVSTPVRNTTLTALQALTLLNDPFVMRQAELFAERVKSRAAALPDQVEAAVCLAYGRAARPDERAALVGYAGRHGLANTCRLLLNSNELVFID